MQVPSASLDFAGKVVVVAGASGGIGAATASVFGACGAQVVLLGRNPGRLNDVAQRMECRPDISHIVRPLDLQQGQASLDALCGLVSELGQVDVVVNCVGINAPSDIFNTPYSVWESVIATNLSGAFVLAKAVCPGMAERRTGAIVNVSSIQARLGGRSIQYAASKAGVEGLTRALARQMAPFGVRVNSVAPGATDTEFGTRHWSSAKRLELENITLLKRIAEPAEIAGAIMFLASDLASYITGITLHVNGGALVD